MGTYSLTTIKNCDAATFVAKLEAAYTIGRNEMDYVSKDYYFADVEKNVFNGTFIVSQNYHADWVDVELPFTRSKENIHYLYIFDDFLKAISAELNTEILLGYAQSTSGEVRVAVFSSGELKLSIHQELRSDNIFISDNYGIESFKHYFNNLPELNHPFEDDQEILCFEEVQNFITQYGRSYDGLEREHDEYLHLEWLNG